VNLLVRLTGVGKQYPTGSATGWKTRFLGRGEKRWALTPLDLTVSSGQSLAILGRNGAGKSTLLGLMGGTVAPTVGEVIRRVDPTLLFVAGTAFDEELSGAENARLELLLRGLRGQPLQFRLAEAREFSEIEDAWDEPLRTYSAGMRARLALSAALAGHGPLLLVDEILAVGDVAFVAKCLDRFRSMRSSGTSIVFVSHNPSQAASLAEEAIVLDHGRVFAKGPVAEALTAYAEITGVPPVPVGSRSRP
jgi:lipopolysaccharide transport system ATP-binding protein